MNKKKNVSPAINFAAVINSFWFSYTNSLCCVQYGRKIYSCTKFIWTASIGHKNSFFFLENLSVFLFHLNIYFLLNSNVLAGVCVCMYVCGWLFALCAQIWIILRCFLIGAIWWSFADFWHANRFLHKNIDCGKYIFYSFKFYKIATETTEKKKIERYSHIVIMPIPIEKYNNSPLNNSIIK